MFLYEALEECYEMEYKDIPNYSKLTFLLKKVLLKMDLAPGGKYQS